MSDPATTCSNCGNTILTSGRFCANCGHVIEAPAEQTPEAHEATSFSQVSESDMPDDNPMVKAGEDADDTAVVPASTDSSQTENVMDDSLSGETQTEITAQDSVEPQSWYASLSASPGDNISSDGGNLAVESTEEHVLQSEQNQPEEPSTPEVPVDSSSSLAPPAHSAGTEQGATYQPPPQSSEWQPGAYDMGATQPVEIPATSMAPPLPPYGAASGQPQSIFSPPPPPAPYTQPMTPQQGYSPPQQAPQQTFTPPPAYSNQGLPPPGTQPLQPGQSHPNYPQYQPGYPPPQQAAAPKDPTTALMLELLGYLGFLGVGHIYAGKTNRGIALLIGWLVYLTASVVLIACLVGCFMFIAWLIVPPLSGLWVKNEMEKERITGFRP